MGIEPTTSRLIAGCVYASQIRARNENLKANFIDSENHFAQVNKALGTYTGFEPVTSSVQRKRSTTEQVCKLCW